MSQFINQPIKLVNFLENKSKRKGIQRKQSIQIRTRIRREKKRDWKIIKGN